MSDTDVYVSPSRVPALIALLLAVLGAAGMAWNFVNGITAALNGAGSGANLYVVLFLISAALVLTAIIISIVCLVRGRARGIAALALLIALAPVAGVIYLYVAQIVA